MNVEKDEAERVRRWWHRLGYAACDWCGTEFRKGKGGGVSRRTICSDRCYRAAWADFLSIPSEQES